MSVTNQKNAQKGKTHSIMVKSMSEATAESNQKTVKTELKKQEVLRMSNEESNRLTKECLQIALIELMNKKDFDKITITELVKRSGVSRTSFYRNYSCKEDILTEMNDGFVEDLAASFCNYTDDDEHFQWYYDAFQAVKNNSFAFGLLVKAHISRNVITGTGSILEKIKPADSLEQHYQFLALEGAFINILTTWFEDGMQESEEFMAQLCAGILH